MIDESIEPTEKEKKWYLEGVANATICIKAAISDELNDKLSDMFHDLKKSLLDEIEDTIDVNIDYMLSGD